LSATASLNGRCTKIAASEPPRWRASRRVAGDTADLIILACQTERGRNLDKFGMHSQDTAELSFTEVRPGHAAFDSASR
jgi:hypothetical protein